jgi:hypothetical protein
MADNCALILLYLETIGSPAKRIAAVRRFITMLGKNIRIERKG